MTALEKRRVLLLHEYPGGFGGAERYLEVLADGLRGAGAETAAVVWCTHKQGGAVVADRLASGGTHVDLRRGRSWPWTVASVVRRWKPDVLHWNAVDPFAFRGGTMLLGPWRRPSVLTDHLPMLRAGIHWETTRRWVNRRVGAVIVVGSDSAVEARAHWPDLRDVRVIRNGVPVGEGVVRTALAPGSPVRLVFAGRLTDQKDPLFALTLVRRLMADGDRPVRLDIVGDGPLRGDLERELVRNPALAAVVRVVGFVPSLGPVFADADVFVAPARFEGLPFTPLEALASGLPLVLSDIAPHREIAVAAARGSGAAGESVSLAAVGDIDAWAGAIGRLARDLPVASAVALAAAQTFSSEAMVAATLALYDEVARDAARSR